MQPYTKNLKVLSFGDGFPTDDYYPMYAYTVFTYFGIEVITNRHPIRSQDTVTRSSHAVRLDSRTSSGFTHSSGTMRLGIFEKSFFLSVAFDGSFFLDGQFFPGTSFFVDK